MRFLANYTSNNKIRRRLVGDFDRIELGNDSLLISDTELIKITRADRIAEIEQETAETEVDIINKIGEIE